MKRFYKNLVVFTLFFFMQSCTQYHTDLNEMEKLQMASMTDIKKGEACSRNLFGGFSLPYFGDTAIKLSGDESVITAIKNADINQVYAVDRLVNNYVFYSRRCIIVFGQQRNPIENKLNNQLKDKSENIKTEF